MAWQVSKRVWDSIKNDKEKGIDSSERLMLLALADKADEQGICLPKYDTSYQTLGEMVGVNRRSAMRLADNLSKKGYLWKSDTAGRGHSNIFIVTIGLTQEETEVRKALIGVTDDTNNNKKVTPTTPIKKEMVLPVTQKGVTDDTNKALNGVTGNTQSNKSPSKPSIPFRDGEPSPTPKKVKTKEPTVTQMEAQSMFKTLADLCQYDLDLISQKERGQLNQAEKKMRDKGYTPDNLKAFGDWWYSHDWRGKQQQPPTLNHIRETWGQFRNYQNGGNGRDSPPKTKLVIIPVSQEITEEL